MNDFIEEQGPAFLAHLLRRLADELVQAAATWYPAVGVSAPPRTVSTLLALDVHGPLGVTELATLLRQSHPLVIVWIRELAALSLIEQRSDAGDRRRTIVHLTPAGRREVPRVREALAVMAEASRGLLALAGPVAWESLWAMERGCREQPFLARLASASREHPTRRAKNPKARKVSTTCLR